MPVLQQPIDYKTVIDLGFEREQCSDSVFFNSYGFQYFIVSIELSKRVSMYWDCNTRFVRISRCDKQGTIIYQKQLDTLDDVIDKLILFGKYIPKKETGIQLA